MKIKAKALVEKLLSESLFDRHAYDAETPLARAISLAGGRPAMKTGQLSWYVVGPKKADEASRILQNHIKTSGSFGLGLGPVKFFWAIETGSNNVAAHGVIDSNDQVVQVVGYGLRPVAAEYRPELQEFLDAFDFKLNDLSFVSGHARNGRNEFGHPISKD